MDSTIPDQLKMSRTLALDLGLSRIGIAVSDPTNTCALPLQTINLKNTPQYHLIIKEIAEELDIDTIVVGLPLDLDGTPGFAVKRTRKMLQPILQILPNCKLIELDERFTSTIAENALLTANISRKKRKENIDAIAASLILQSHLASKNNT